MSEIKAPTVPELREMLREAEKDAAYWRGRAESLEGLVAQRSQPSANSLPPELLTALLAAKMKDKKDAVNDE
jgi:hypothetical protein